MHDPAAAGVLVATTVHWASTTRLALALPEAGLRVAAVAPAEHALHRMDAQSHARSCVPRFALRFCVRRCRGHDRASSGDGRARGRSDRARAACAP